MDEVSIPVTLLEQINDTLESAYWFNYTFDLQDYYRRQNRGEIKESKLTNNLGGAQGIVKGFIEMAKSEAEEEDGQSSDSE